MGACPDEAVRASVVDGGSYKPQLSSMPAHVCAVHYVHFYEKIVQVLEYAGKDEHTSKEASLVPNRL